MSSKIPDRPEVSEAEHQYEEHLSRRKHQKQRKFFFFEPILRDIGAFGRFQKTQLLFLALAASFVCVFCNFSLYFLLYTPPHWCKMTSAGIVSHIIKQEIRNGTDYNCKIFNDNFVSTTECPFQWEHDTSQMRSTIVTEHNLYCSKSTDKELIITLTQVGTIVGIFVFSNVQDRFGRKPAFFGCLTVYILTGAASVLWQDLPYFVAMRALSKMVAVPSYQIPYIMAVELVGPDQRTMVTSIMAITFSVVVSLLCLIAYLCSDVFVFGLVTSLPLAVFYSYHWLITESPRWLMMHDRFEELESLVFHIAKVNNRILPRDYNIQDVMTEHQPADPIELQVIQLELSTTPEQSAKKVRFWHLFRTPNLRIKVIVLSILWIANATVYYGLHYIASMGSFTMYAFQALIEIPAACMNWYLLDRVGRIIPSAGTMLIAGSCATGCFFFYYPTPIIVPLLILTSLTKFCIASSYSIIYQQSAELYPTEARAMGIGASAFCGNIGALGMPYIIGLSKTLKMLPMLVLGGISVLGALVALFLPDTSDEKLPESLNQAEKRGKVSVMSLKRNLTMKIRYGHVRRTH